MVKMRFRMKCGRGWRHSNALLDAGAVLRVCCASTSSSSKGSGSGSGNSSSVSDILHDGA
jgi:hypothetical protein